MKSITICLALLPALAWGATTTVVCPPTLTVQTPVDVPAGWEVMKGPSAVLLERVGLYAGHPSGMASLVPDKSQTRKGEAIDTWTFWPNAPDEPWLACFYGGQELMMARPLGQGTTRCDVHYRVSRSGTRQELLAVQCEGPH